MWPSFGHASWPYAHLFQYVFVVLLFDPDAVRLRGGSRRAARARARPAAPRWCCRRSWRWRSPSRSRRARCATAIPFDIFFIVIACALATGDAGAAMDGGALDAMSVGARCRCPRPAGNP